MLFQELNKLKRQSIMTSISLIALGIIMIFCPDDYVKPMVGMLGAVLVIFGILGVLDFVSSKRALIHYIYLTGALLAGTIGFIVLFFEINSLYAISILFGAYLTISGISSIVSAVTYAKRSGRRGWAILVILAVLQIIFGLIIFINPWWDTPGALFSVVGLMLLFSSLVSILRLIWIWPIRNE